LQELHARLQAAANESRRVELTLKRLVGGEFAFSYTQRSMLVRDLQMIGENASN